MNYLILVSVLLLWKDDQKQFGEEEVYLWYTCQSESIMKGSQKETQGRNWEAGAAAEPKKES